MVFTRKFSEFPDGGVLATPDMPVGLETGVNTRWTFQGGGGGGGGSVTQVLPQQMPPVNNGDWVRITPASGIYTAGQADTPEDAEIIGIVIESNVATFTLQQSGYITTQMGVPSIVGLTPGTVYFLDVATLGTMVPNDAVVDGTVSRPVFVADSPTSGWVLPYRGSIVGGQPSPSPSPTPGSDTSLVTINQTAHGFIPGDVLKVATPASAGVVAYAKAQANTLANAQAVGVVVANPAPTTNQFTLQFSGYNTGSITTDDLGNPVVASVPYYLSSTVAGKVTSINPILAVSKPIYIPEQGTANLGVNAGYILPQRPLDVTDENTNVHTVFAVNTFNPGQWVYIQSDNTYQLAIATSLTTSQVAGVITAASGTQFTVQQSGWVAGVVSTTYIDTGTITTGAVYYLSAVNAGNLSISPPVTIGQISKPCYVQENATGRIGEILPQRPIVITAPGNGGYLQLFATNDLTNVTVLDLPNIFGTAYKYVQIIGQNICVVETGSPFAPNATGFLMQLYANGSLITTTNYSGTAAGLAPGGIGAGILIAGVFSSFSDARSKGNLNFTINFYNLNSTTVTKYIDVSSRYFSGTLPPSSGAGAVVADKYVYQELNLNPTNGVKFTAFHSQPVQLTQGTLLFYGIPA